jgi:phosphoglucosamine mutase
MKLFGSSGIRAVYNRNLLETAFRVGLTVGKKYGNVVVGRDTRTSGDAMNHAVLSGLLAAGARCSDAGIAPTPTIAYITRDFDCGIMITASHNPPEYNGLKLLNPDGSSFDTPQQAEIESMLLACDDGYADWRQISQCAYYKGAIERHINGVLADFPQKLGIKVVVDAGGGAASEVTPHLMEKMGCEVVPLNCVPDGHFPRGSEPVEENLKGLCQVVRETGAAVGIAHDGDSDRMMAVDEKGRYISGDKMLAVLIRAIGAKDAVTTLDATMAIDDIGVKIRRTKIGDTWVSEELRKGGEFGGETSGAWIFPQISLCPDGIYAAAQIATIAAGNRLSKLVDAVPVYPLFRGNVGSNGLDMAKLDILLEATKPRAVSRIDGVKLYYLDGWLLVRPSGTEPKIRLTAEARTEKLARELFERGLEAVRNSIDGGRKTN